MLKEDDTGERVRPLRIHFLSLLSPLPLLFVLFPAPASSCPKNSPLRLRAPVLDVPFAQTYLAFGDKHKRRKKT
ncbi:hypothetical protein BKA57DRAFT_255616 [Linnemannia elongata]|nr:hypothetical protein BKA57DRAFT_255616 [Linnemannia elongata]